MATVTLYPVVAGFMQLENATTTFRSYSGGNSFLATGFFGSPQTNRGLLFFDISSLGADFTINSATLKLTVQTNFLGTSHTLNVYRLRRFWHYVVYGGTDWSQASWNNYRQDHTAAWSTAGAGNTTTDRDSATIGTYAIAAGNPGDGSQISITLDTTKVGEWVSGSFANCGLLLQASDESGTTLMRWEGPDNATTANRPQLVIDYTPSSHTLTEGILAYWKADESSGNMADSSGNGLTLTQHNTPTYGAGKLNNAVQLASASSQYLTSSSSSLKLGDTDWTACCWAKLTDNAALYTVWEIGDFLGAGGGFKLFYHQQSILDYFVAQLYNDQTVTADCVIADVISYDAGNPPTGTWLFLAVRHDHTRNWYHLFADYGSGLQVNSATSHDDGANYGPYPGYTNTGSAPTAPTTDFALGRDQSNSGQHYYKGSLDEIGFWTRWLSATEIAAVRDSVAGGLSYPFTAGSGTYGRRRALGGYGGRRYQ